MTFTTRETTLLAGDFRAEIETSRARRAAAWQILNHLPGQHDQSSHGKGGGGAGMHDGQKIQEAFDFDDAATGIRASVAEIHPGRTPGSLSVGIELTDREGKLVGTVIQEIRAPVEKTVELVGIELDPGMQGQGFASRYLAHSEEVYRANGIERVELHANIDVGGYAWARAGYDFADANTRDVIARVARRAADSYSDETTVVAIGRVAANPDSTPADFAMIGHAPGAETWPGREIMLGSSWRGVKQL